MYRSADSAMLQDEIPSDLPGENLNTPPVSGFPPHNMTLKMGSPVILLRNLDPQRGLSNETRLIVTNLKSRVSGCLILSGTHRGENVVVPRIRLITNPTTQLPFFLKRSQFPIRPAFAMSINKAQGQSVRHIGLELTHSVFSHGQLYVDLSRSTAMD